MRETATELERRADAALREGAEQQAYWEQHWHELQQDYPDQFVAVRDGIVVAAARDLPHLVADLAARGLAVKQTWIHFVEVTPRVLAL